MKTGLYHYPGLGDPEMVVKVTEGPRIPLMVFKSEGTSVFNPMDFVMSLLLNLATAALLFFVLKSLTSPSLYNVLLVSAAIGLLTGALSDFPLIIWYLFPIEHAIINLMDHMISLLLAGWIIKSFALK